VYPPVPVVMAAPDQGGLYLPLQRPSWYPRKEYRAYSYQQPSEDQQCPHMKDPEHMRATLAPSPDHEKSRFEPDDLSALYNSECHLEVRNCRFETSHER